MMNTKKTDFQINSTKVTIKIQWFITEIALLLNKTETNLLATKYKHISKPKDFEKGRENKTRFETEQLKNNINKAAFNIWFSRNLFLLLSSSARMSCSIVLNSSLTWSHFLLSQFPLTTNTESHFFSASSMYCVFLF